MGSVVKNEEYFVSDYIKVYPGQKLYKSGSSAGTSNCFYDENKNFISTVRLVGGVISVPTTNSISYMRTNGPLTDLDSIQITSGDTQSTYEAYIEPKIFIKNDNNIYEEFIKKQEENYSEQERIIGTWIDGKPLYRKVIIINNIALNKGENTIAHGISNIDKGIKISCFNYSGVILPYINLNADSSLKTATFITGINSTNIVFRVVNDSWGAQNNWCVIMEYTKTTD